MADSNITKRALAVALRELMEEIPFEKINVAQICEKCGMNRKSFYYHFRDKYDLVNWIFDTEFIPIAKEGIDANDYNSQWTFIEQACDYFYENRSFYRKALKIKGQNSFSEHLREYSFPLIKFRMENLLGNEYTDDFGVTFFTDAVIYTIERWLLDKDCLPPDQFTAKLKSFLQTCVDALHKEMNSSE